MVWFDDCVGVNECIVFGNIFVLMVDVCVFYWYCFEGDFVVCKMVMFLDDYGIEVVWYGSVGEDVVGVWFGIDSC